MDKDTYIHIIIELVKTVENNSDKKNVLCEEQTMLNKMLRSYKPSWNSILVSDGAYKLFTSLSSEQIDKTRLTRNFKANNIKSSHNEVEIYENMSNKPKLISIKKNEKYKSKDFFIGDHIVPIKTIIENLKNLHRNKQLTVKNVEKELDKIKIAYITTKEDREIVKNNKSSKSKRNDNYKNVIDTVYKDAGITFDKDEKIEG